MWPLAQRRIADFVFILVLLVGGLGIVSPVEAQTEKRIAFVIGNGAYPQGALATPANDAGLIAQTLQAAGFDVTGARDLDGESLRGAFRDFLDKVQSAGPDTVAFIYLAGYGLQLDGENYFAPVDARIASLEDIPVAALRLSDYTRRLSGLPIKAGFVVLDAARAQPFIQSGTSLAGGLALVDPDPNLLIAFNASPGTVAPSENGPYGTYAQALTEMIREGGLGPSDLFDAVRLRVSETSQGALVPWDASQIAAPFVFFNRAANAPPPAFAADKFKALHSTSLSTLSPQDAYAVALERDTVKGYEEFLAAYPDDPLAKRVRALLAARREAITWRRTCRVATPDAYWSYLVRYPHGPHAADARQRLQFLSAALVPPPTFTPIAYDVPPPPPAEIVYVNRPVLAFSDPAWGFGPPPPPIAYLAPVPAYLAFPPPPPPIGLYVLPQPAFVAVPTYVNPPAYVAAPPQNIVFQNLHNATVVNNVTVVNGAGAGQGGGIGTAAGIAGGVAAGAAAGAIATRVALPPSVAGRAGTVGTAPANLGASQPPANGALGHLPAAPAGSVPAAGLPAGHILPGGAGHPLPANSPAQGPGVAPAPNPSASVEPTSSGPAATHGLPVGGAAKGALGNAGHALPAGAGHPLPANSPAQGLGVAPAQNPNASAEPTSGPAANHGLPVGGTAKTPGASAMPPAAVRVAPGKGSAQKPVGSNGHTPPSADPHASPADLNVGSKGADHELPAAPANEKSLQGKPPGPKGAKPNAKPASTDRQGSLEAPAGKAVPTAGEHVPPTSAKPSKAAVEQQKPQPHLPQPDAKPANKPPQAAKAEPRKEKKEP